MRTYRSIFAALALTLLLTAAGEAQERRTIVITRGALGIMHEAVPANSINARQRVVVSVVPGSAAQKAGILEGDTIVRINGLAATAQVMSAPFAPGDTVVLRVKRRGGERDIRVIAEERSRHVQAMMADSVSGRLAIILDEMRVVADSTSFPWNVRAFGGDSGTTIIVGTDTIRAGRTLRALHPDSMRWFADSMRWLPDSMRAMFRRFPADSLVTEFRMSRAVPFMVDSAMGDRQIFRVFTDSVFFRGDSIGARPFEMMTIASMLGMRAVAGAELSDLNEGLGEYFGTTSGVLVLNAREGTPAAIAGLRGGDVIIRVNGEAVRNVGELRRQIDAARGGTIQFRVLRRGQNVDVTLR